MASPVILSEKPLVLDVLPVLKVCHYDGRAKEGNIYTLGRFYLRPDALCLSLTVFERDPPPQSGVGFSLAGAEGDSCLLLSVTPRDVKLERLEGEQRTPLAAPEMNRTSGADEQGWFWGVETALGVGLLEGVGYLPEKGALFRAGLMKTSEPEGAVGTSFAPGGPAGRWRVEDLQLFEAVAY